MVVLCSFRKHEKDTIEVDHIETCLWSPHRMHAQGTLQEMDGDGAADSKWHWLPPACLFVSRLESV